MTPKDSDQNKWNPRIATPAARGEAAFACFDVAIKIVKVPAVVFGVMIVIIALSGVAMGSLDDHDAFRYRMYAAPVCIVAYLLIDYLNR